MSFQMAQSSQPSKTEEEEFDPQKEFSDCCKYCDEQVGLEILKNYNVDPCLPDEFGTAPIHAAAANGLVALMTEIVKKPGVNLNLKTNGGNTPLHYAALNRNTNIIRILVNAGADTKIKNSQGQSPLFHAVEQFADNKEGEAEAVDLLVGPDSEIPECIQGPEEDFGEDTTDEPKK